MSDGASLALVESARGAAAQGDWQQAFDLLTKADADGFLAPADLPMLGGIAYAAGHLDVTIEVWERAHAACMQAGDQVAAAGAAVRVAMHLLFDTALMAPVRGWLARAEGLLEGHEETSAYAWFAVVRTYERMLTGDVPGARQWARRAIEVGSKSDPAACAIGRVAEARLLILDGDVQQGLAQLDEAGVAILSGDLDPFSTGVVYCELVCALQGLARAQRWEEMPGLVSDEMLDAYAVIGTHDVIAAKLRGRYAHLATALEFAIPLEDAGDETALRGLIDSLRKA
jgi:hypothetical protein